MVKNSLSVDLESFIHREFNIEKRDKKDNEFTLRATCYLLELLNKHKTKITFFVVGEIYDMYPNLIADIKSEGHEIGFHSHNHIFIKTKEDLQRELSLSKSFIDKYKPIGFRAPRMEVQADLFDVLKKHNFKYDSSTYNQYEKIELNGIRELSVSVTPYPFLSNRPFRLPQNLKMAISTRGIPYGSGLFIALLGKNIRYFIDQTNKNNFPAVLFIHPWQLMQYESIFSSRNFYNLPKMMYKKNISKTLEFLLSTYKFVPMKNLL
jgi:peptidoglycan-N-acetylglucosamine deacetylase